MKRVIRQNVFEANSSSCHTIAITRKFEDRLKSITGYSVKSSFNNMSELSFSRGLYDSNEYFIDKVGYSFIALCAYMRYTLKLETETVIEEYDRRVSLVLDEVKKISVVSGCTLNPIDVVVDAFEKIKQSHIFNKDEESRYFAKWCYIDHTEEIMHFAKAVYDDDEKLMRFIFDEKSYFVVSGDEYQGHYAKKVGFEYDYDTYEDWKKRVDEFNDEFEIFT